MGRVSIITGATGLVGSHIAQQLCQTGESVRALVRSTSNTRFLQNLPVEIVVTDLHKLHHNIAALDDAGTIYHCAAFVRDWGTWQEFYEGTVETTRQLVEACRLVGAGRFLHVSSVSVFGNPPLSAGLITEDSPTGKYLWRGDYYGRAKILAEEIVRTYDDYVIARPSWIYGPRDSNSLPRIIAALRRQRVKLIGPGDNLLNLVHAADVARGVILAARSPEACRKVFHFCSPGEITQRDFFDLLSDHLGLPRVGQHVPFGLAWYAASALEFLYRIAGSKSPPPVTRRAILMLSRPIRFSITKAENELGWRPSITAVEGIAEALDWAKKQALEGRIHAIP